MFKDMRLIKKRSLNIQTLLENEDVSNDVFLNIK